MKQAEPSSKLTRLSASRMELVIRALGDVAMSLHSVETGVGFTRRKVKKVNQGWCNDHGGRVPKQFAKAGSQWMLSRMSFHRSRKLASSKL